MRVMILAKTTPEAENAPPPSNPEGFEAIGRFHEELASAGILLESGRLQPSSRAVRVRFEREKRRVIDGPFVEAKEIVGGYWIWQVSSLDQAIDWLKRAPFDGGDFEVRPIYEMDEMGAASA
jgi:hypothetical protein